MAIDRRRFLSGRFQGLPGERDRPEAAPHWRVVSTRGGPGKKKDSPYTTRPIAQVVDDLCAALSATPLVRGYNIREF